MPENSRTVWRFSRKRDGKPMDKLEVIFENDWVVTPSSVLDHFKWMVEEHGLDEV
jgi:hypothetical protein